MPDTYFAEAYRLVERLKQATSKEQVAEIMDGASWGAFTEIDERPGLFDPHPYDGYWFAWLRQLRNDRNSDMLDRLVR